VDRLFKLQDEHRREIKDLKDRMTNDVNLQKAMNKQGIDKYLAEIARLEKTLKQAQFEVTKIKQA